MALYEMTESMVSCFICTMSYFPHFHAGTIVFFFSRMSLYPSLEDLKVDKVIRVSSVLYYLLIC